MSSFFSQASFVMDPSVYRAGTLFVPKPTDGSGDLTITRTGDTATRVGPNGYIEKVRTNLALQSQTFENASWTKANSSITANATTAPDGTTTADKLIENTATSTHLVSQNITASNIPFTYSVYVKGDATTRVRVQMSDLTTGDIRLDYDFITDTSLLNASGTRGSWTPLGYTKTDISGGWVRISISGIKGAGSTAAITVFLLDASGNSVYTGDGTSGLFVWGAQLEAGDIATNYIPTTTTAVSVGPVANVPRLNYSEGCPSLLLEPQRTNLLTYSEQFENSAYTKVGGSVVANNSTSPDGYANADTFTADGANSTHRLFQTFSATSGTTYTASFFVKKGTADFVQIAVSSGTAFGITNFANFDISTGVVSTSGGLQTNNTITNYGNGWYRISSTITAIGTATAQVDLCIIQAANSVRLQSWTSSASVVLYGAQLEVGSYVSSYVNTLGAAVTRGVDAASKTGISSLIGQTEGTLFFDLNTIANGQFKRLSINNGAFTNSIFFDFDNANQLYAKVINGGVATHTLLSNVSIANTQKIAFAYKANDFAFYVNGNLVASSASGTVPSGLSAYQFSLAGNQLFEGAINQALLFKTRLPNSELAKLTSL